MNALPAILKFGLTGLAALVVLFAYQLLRGESKKELPRPLIVNTINHFMRLGIALTALSLIGSVTELITNLMHEQSLNALQAKLAEAQNEITRLTEAAGTQKTTDQLERELSALKTELTDVERTATARRAALNRIIADQLEQILYESRGKVSLFSESEQPKVRHSLLRRGVFLNMLTFEADGAILRTALDELVKRQSDLKPAAEEIITDLPKLKASKLRWLREDAIPALQETIQKTFRSPVQREAKADVLLPKEFVVVNQREFGEPKVTVTNMPKLQEEVDLLKRTL